ncbi:MAG: Asp-tRNA(Asn)/Glu-tRNA(Gln) amidotransferase subunit GatC [Candidatus Parcubacteria bacterium]|nr:Asp-tRNA(Asn)/Glu-tRNA(Gln) amidotransferase subunit GatC [Candidatus Parcubacteria bacterium]
MISNKDVQNLAELSRIEVKEEELENIRQKLEGILAYVSEVQDLAKEKISSDTSDVGENHNVFREDVEPHEGGKYTEGLIQNAPNKEGNYVKVRKIL